MVSMPTLKSLLQIKMNQDQTEKVQEEKPKGEDSLRYICRTCLNNIEMGETFMFINDYAKSIYFENLRISYMIEKSVPELDLDISDSPIICNTCYNMLWYTYLFKLRCFQTEEKIFMYVEKNKLNFGDKIDIREIRESKNIIDETIINDAVDTALISDENKSIQDVICISDSDSNDDDNDEEEGEVDIEGGDDDNVDDLSRPTDVADGESSVDKKKSFSCQQCDSKGSRPDLLDRHKENCHAKKFLRSYNCHSCLYSTFRKRNLRRHELVHGEVKPFICGICERGFSERYNLKNHMYKHSGKPLPFKCGEVGCKAAFARKCDLSVHIVTHMSYSPNMCQECNKAFLTREQLERHKKKYRH